MQKGRRTPTRTGSLCSQTPRRRRPCKSITRLRSTMTRSGGWRRAGTAGDRGRRGGRGGPWPRTRSRRRGAADTVVREKNHLDFQKKKHERGSGSRLLLSPVLGVPSVQAPEPPQALQGLCLHLHDLLLGLGLLRVAVVGLGQPVLANSRHVLWARTPTEELGGLEFAPHPAERLLVPLLHLELLLVLLPAQLLDLALNRANLCAVVLRCGALRGTRRLRPGALPRPGQLAHLLLNR
mmetsp:Transcript_6760/g.23291  ORF Transcript_6760/g.23291 Transcript_6760/m.23291 type:complete len:237 (+) Transcript_6760:1842-2552(+)